MASVPGIARRSGSRSEPPDGTPTSFGWQCWAGSGRSMPRPHVHNDVELNFAIDEPMAYLMAGRLVRVPVRRLCAFWAAAPHRLIHPGGAMHWATLPIGDVMAWPLPDAFRVGFTQGVIFLAAEHDEPEADLALLRRWHHDLKAADPQLQRVAQLEVQARIRRLALTGSPLHAPPINTRRRKRAAAPADAASQPAPDAVLLMHRFIADRYQHDLSVDDIAAVAHLQGGYAMSLFRKHTGSTLNQTLTRYRLWHAQRLLLTSERSVLEIALDAGFGSLSRFYEAFHRACGCSPLEYRRRGIAP